MINLTSLNLRIRNSELGDGEGIVIGSGIVELGNLVNLELDFGKNYIIEIGSVEWNKLNKLESLVLNLKMNEIS